MQRNEERAEKYQTFEDLEVYQLARELRRAMYPVAKGLPETEKFGLANQIRRAAVSLPNNIAEGHGRYHFLDQIKFVLQARGSLEELLDDLNVCEDEKYFANAEIGGLKERAWRVHKVMNAYIRFLTKRVAEKPGRLQELPDDELNENDFDEVIPFNPSTL